MIIVSTNIAKEFELTKSKSIALKQPPAASVVLYGIIITFESFCLVDVLAKADTSITDTRKAKDDNDTKSKGRQTNT
jgi:hypothetical protein